MIHRNCCLVHWRGVAWSTGDVLLGPLKKMLLGLLETFCLVYWQGAAWSTGEVLLGPLERCCLVHRRGVAWSTGEVLLGPLERCCLVHWRGVAWSIGEVLLGPAYSVAFCSSHFLSASLIPLWSNAAELELIRRPTIEGQPRHYYFIILHRHPWTLHSQACS